MDSRTLCIPESGRHVSCVATFGQQFLTALLLLLIPTITVAQENRLDRESVSKLLQQEDYLDRLLIAGPDVKDAVLEILISESVSEEVLNRTLVDPESSETTDSREKFERAIFGLDPEFAMRDAFLKRVNEAKLLEADGLSRQDQLLLEWSLHLIDQGTTPPKDFVVRLARKIAFNVNSPALQINSSMIDNLVRRVRHHPTAKFAADSDQSKQLERMVVEQIDSETSPDKKVEITRLKLPIAMLSEKAATRLFETTVATAKRLDREDVGGDEYSDRVTRALDLARLLDSKTDPADASALQESVVALREVLEGETFNWKTDRIISGLQRSLPDSLEEYLKTPGDHESGELKIASAKIAILDEDHAYELSNRFLKIAREQTDNRIAMVEIANLSTKIAFPNVKQELASRLLKLGNSQEGECQAKSYQLSLAGRLYDFASPKDRQLMRERYLPNLKNVEDNHLHACIYFQMDVAKTLPPDQIAEMIELLSEAKVDYGRPNYDPKRVLYVPLVTLYEQKIPGNQNLPTAGLNIDKITNFDPGTKPAKPTKADYPLDPRLYRIIEKLVDDPDAETIEELVHSSLIPSKKRTGFFRVLFLSMTEMRRLGLVRDLLERANLEIENMEAYRDPVVRGSRLPGLSVLMLAAPCLDEAQTREVVLLYLNRSRELEIRMGGSLSQMAFVDAITWADKDSSIVYWKTLIDEDPAAPRAKTTTRLFELGPRLHTDAIADCVVMTRQMNDSRIKSLASAQLKGRIKFLDKEETQKLLNQLTLKKDRPGVESFMVLLGEQLKEFDDVDTTAQFLDLLNRLVENPGEETFRELGTATPKHSRLELFQSEDRLRAVELLLTASEKFPGNWRRLNTTLRTMSIGLPETLDTNVLIQILEVLTANNKASRMGNLHLDVINDLSNEKCGAIMAELLGRLSESKDEVGLKKSFESLELAFALSIKSAALAEQFNDAAARWLAQSLVESPASVRQLVINRRFQTTLDQDAVQVIVDRLKSPHVIGADQEDILASVSSLNHQDQLTLPRLITWIKAAHPEVDLTSAPKNIREIAPLSGNLE